MIKVLNMSTNLFLLVILWSFFNEYLWSVWNLFLCKEYDKDTVSFYHEATWPWISSSLLSFLFNSQLCSIRWSAQTRHIVHYLFNWSNPWWLIWQKICLQWRRPGFHSWVGKTAWRREWLPLPVFLPGEFHGQRSLTGFSPCGCKELDMTEHLTLLTIPQWSGKKQSVNDG